MLLLVKCLSSCAEHGLRKMAYPALMTSVPRKCNNAASCPSVSASPRIVACFLLCLALSAAIVAAMLFPRSGLHPSNLHITTGCRIALSRPQSALPAHCNTRSSFKAIIQDEQILPRPSGAARFHVADVNQSPVGQQLPRQLTFRGLCVVLAAAAIAGAVGGHAMAVQAVKPPHVSVPHVSVPHISVPHTSVEHIEVPHINVPHVAVPHIVVPHVFVPHVSVPRVAVSRVAEAFAQKVRIACATERTSHLMACRAISELAELATPPDIPEPRAQ